MDRLGLGWETVKSRNPGIIYCSLPGFGTGDPRAPIPAWEGVIGAATGAYPSRGDNAASPVFTALPIASAYAAIAAAVAVTMALIARERLGAGQRIEVPLFDATFLAIGAGGLLVNGMPAGGRPDDPGRRLRCLDGGSIRLSLATPAFGGASWRRQGAATGSNAATSIRSASARNGPSTRTGTSAARFCRAVSPANGRHWAQRLTSR